MKSVFSLLLIAFLIFTLGCDKEGKVLLPRLIVECSPEINGPDDVRNCTIELHATPLLNSPLITVKSEGTADFASGVFEELNPNTYYCQIWKDNNSNDTMDSGDYYGAWPQELVITDTTDLTITIVTRLMH